MEESKGENGDASIELLTATSNGTEPRTNTVNITNGPNSVHQDMSNNKHSYWRGRGMWGRSSESSDSLNKFVDPNRAMIDTKAPFESVKDAVNMFGGNVEWKALSAIIKERSRNIEQELEKAEKEVPLFQKQLETAEDAKASVLRELEITKKREEDLSLQLQKAVTEEAQAQQDSELAELRVKEIEQGIVYENSVAAKEQVKVAITRYQEADDELKSVEIEFDILKKECEELMKEKDIAAKKTEEAILASKDVDRRIGELVIERNVANEALELARALHLKAEERRLVVAMEWEEERLDWEKKLKQSQEELHCFEEKLAVINDLKLKFNTSYALLTSLKLEFNTYVETERVLEENTEFVQPESLISAKKELVEVKNTIEKAKDEVNCLRIATSSLKSELEAESSKLSFLKQKEKVSGLAISYLEAKLEKVREMPEEFHDKTGETYEAKSKPHSARQELTRAIEEDELAKASTNTIELGLKAVLKEIEASKASEKLALEAINAIQGSAKAIECAEEVICIPLEEYHALSRKAGGAERLSNEKVIAAVAQIKEAKRKESVSREKLEAVCKEKKERKEVLRSANEKAEKAMEGKLRMEQELRDWRAENEERRKAGVRCHWKSFDDGRDINGLNPAAISLRVNSTPNPNRHCIGTEGNGHAIDLCSSRRKKSFFPRLVMFLARRKMEPYK